MYFFECSFWSGLFCQKHLDRLLLQLFLVAVKLKLDKFIIHNICVNRLKSCVYSLDDSIEARNFCLPPFLSLPVLKIRNASQKCIIFHQLSYANVFYSFRPSRACVVLSFECSAPNNRSTRDMPRPHHSLCDLSGYFCFDFFGNWYQLFFVF